MSHDDAVQNADNLLIELIKHQPQLLAPTGPRDARHGAEAAAFVAALRNGLIKMYETPGE